MPQNDDDKPWKKNDDRDDRADRDGEDDDRPRKKRRRDEDADRADRDGEDDDRPRKKRRQDEDDDFDDYGEEDQRGGRLSRTDLREIAGRQRAILLCILGFGCLYLCLIPVQIAIPEENRIHLALALTPLGLIPTVFVFLLAVKLYGESSGFVYGILTLIPCVGLIVLLIINQKATALLKENGVRVGLLGAKSSDL